MPAGSCISRSSERPQLAAGDGIWHGERVAAEHVDVFVAERRKPGLVFRQNWVALASKLSQDRVRVQRVPQDDHVDDQTEGAELIFLAFAIPLVQLAALAVENVAGQAVPAFAEIELLQGTAPAVLVVDKSQRVDGLVDAADLGDGLRQRGWTIIDLQGSHDAHGGDESELERADQAQHIVPVWRDPVEVDALPGQRVEITVVGVRVDAPKAAPADVGQASVAIAR